MRTCFVSPIDKYPYVLLFSLVTAIPDNTNYRIRIHSYLDILRLQHLSRTCLFSHHMQNQEHSSRNVYCIVYLFHQVRICDSGNCDDTHNHLHACNSCWLITKRNIPSHTMRTCSEFDSHWTLLYLYNPRESCIEFLSLIRSRAKSRKRKVPRKQTCRRKVA